MPTRGLPRIGPVKNMSYGVRQFLVTDPGGNTLRIGQPIADSFELTSEDRAAIGDDLRRAEELVEALAL